MISIRYSVVGNESNYVRQCIQFVKMLACATVYNRKSEGTSHWGWWRSIAITRFWNRRTRHYAHIDWTEKDFFSFVLPHADFSSTPSALTSHAVWHIRRPSSVKYVYCVWKWGKGTFCRLHTRRGTPHVIKKWDFVVHSNQAHWANALELTVGLVRSILPSINGFT